MSILRSLKRRQIFVGTAVLAAVCLVSAGIASANMTVKKSSAKVDVASVAAAYNAGDKDALDSAIAKLKNDLNASLDAKVAKSTTTTVAAADPDPVVNDDMTKMTIGIIGDSLTDMGGSGPQLLTDDFVSRGWDKADVKVDGLGGRGIDAPTSACPEDRPSPYTSAVIDKWRKAGFDPQIWLIALGTNNTGSSNDCQKALITGVINKINSGPAGNYKIFWLGIGFREANQNNSNSFNSRLTATAQQENFTACDYDAWLTENRRSQSDYNSLWSDGTHSPNADAYKELRVPAYGQCVLSQF